MRGPARVGLDTGRHVSKGQGNALVRWSCIHGKNDPWWCIDITSRCELRHHQRCGDGERFGCLRGESTFGVEWLTTRDSAWNGVPGEHGGGVAKHFPQATKYRSNNNKVSEVGVA
jgi:hypothetical protein